MLIIGICEDEGKILKFLERVVEDYLISVHEEYEIFSCDNGKDLLDTKKIFDIVFLDIEFPPESQMNGIEIGWALRERSKKTKIIFVTGYEKYRLEAQEMHCFYYLRKPMEEEDICKQLRDAIEYIEEYRIENCESIFFETIDGYTSLKVREIFYFYYVSNRRIEIVTNNKKYMIKCTMKELQEKMKEYPFVLSHQAYFVNLYNIKRPFAKKLKLTNDEEIPLADRRAKLVKEAFFKMIYEKKG